MPFQMFISVTDPNFWPTVYRWKFSKLIPIKIWFRHWTNFDLLYCHTWFVACKLPKQIIKIKFHWEQNFIILPYLTNRGKKASNKPGNSTLRLHERSVIRNTCISSSYVHRYCKLSSNHTNTTQFKYKVKILQLNS